MKLEAGEITSVKCGRVWIASTLVTKPIKAETNMQGRTKEIAEEKLKLFLAGKPYSHLV